MALALLLTCGLLQCEGRKYVIRLSHALTFKSVREQRGRKIRFLLCTSFC